MITRKEIDKRLKASEGLYTNAVVQMLDEEAARYKALVDAAVAFAGEHILVGSVNTPEFVALHEAVNPFLPSPPPPLLSEKLDKLADEWGQVYDRHAEIHQLAAEARKLEN